MASGQCVGCKTRFVGTNRLPWTKERIDKHQKSCPEWRARIAKRRQRQPVRPIAAQPPSNEFAIFSPVLVGYHMLTPMLQQSALPPPNKRPRLSEPISLPQTTFTLALDSEDRGLRHTIEPSSTSSTSVGPSSRNPASDPSERTNLQQSLSEVC